MFSHRENSARRIASRTALPQGGSLGVPIKLRPIQKSPPAEDFFLFSAFVQAAHALGLERETVRLKNAGVRAALVRVDRLGKAAHQAAVAAAVLFIGAAVLGTLLIRSITRPVRKVKR